jgi:hypothetical protein
MDTLDGNRHLEDRLRDRMMSRIQVYFQAATLVGFALLNTGEILAGAKLSKLRQGMPFAKARELLLDGGWQGLRKYPFPERAGQVGYVFYELGYMEVVDCAGTGVAPCIFMYKDAKGRQLEVRTYGEERLTLDTWQFK